MTGSIYCIAVVNCFGGCTLGLPSSEGKTAASVHSAPRSASAVDDDRTEAQRPDQDHCTFLIYIVPTLES